MKKLVMLLMVFNVVIFCAGCDDSRKTEANAVREVWYDLCDDIRDGDVDGAVEHMTGAPKKALREATREACAMYRQTGVLETILDVRVEGDTAYLQTDMGYSIVFSKEGGTWKYNVPETVIKMMQDVQKNQ
jgi:ketosteroid isomerase-like protein